jgi:pimeloyl-ACP methyl ester carboxylesterase
LPEPLETFVKAPMRPIQAPPAAAPERTWEPNRLGSLRCLSTAGFHHIAYTDWGPQSGSGTVVCVHGLTRQGRDFDYLARSLAAAGFRVICPDLVGRGRSGWLPHVLDYVFPQYCADMATLLAALGSTQIHWIGTSLGGLIGIVLASMTDSPITKLVVNDIGPDVPTCAAGRVGVRIDRQPTRFASLDEAERYNRRAFAACGDLTDEQWRHFTIHALREDADGKHYVPLMDPKVVTAYHLLLYYQLTLWRYWRKIRIPILAIHGEYSDFVSPALIHDMKLTTPQLQTHRVGGVGHMPMLMSVDEIGPIEAFLRQD